MQGKGYREVGGDVGYLLDLGLALGHSRFEVVRTGGGDTRNGDLTGASRVGAHMWAERADGGAWELTSPRRLKKRESNNLTSGWGTRESEMSVRGKEEMRWLRERVENLQLELQTARRDNNRLAEMLKEEEARGREQRRKAQGALAEARVLREEAQGLKGENRAAITGASKAALSNATDHSVWMGERKRRQQAER
ncbi:unnamed protein product [Discosporangium mesarthrocarpum]